MPMCAGLVGPKSENVEISSVLPLFFEGSRWPGGFRRSINFQKWIFWGQLLAYEGDFGVSSEPFRRRKALDGDFDAYVCGLGGAKK